MKERSNLYSILKSFYMEIKTQFDAYILPFMFFNLIMLMNIFIFFYFNSFF